MQGIEQHREHSGNRNLQDEASDHEVKRPAAHHVQTKGRGTEEAPDQEAIGSVAVTSSCQDEKPHGMFGPLSLSE